MIGTKLFPDFTLQAHASQKDQEFLQTFLGVKKLTKAQYVNFSVVDYRAQSSESKFFLTYPLDWILRYLKNSFQDSDPVPKIDYRRVSFVDWRDLWRSDEDIKFFNATQEFGIGENGVTLTAHLGNHSYGALSLVFDQKFESWQRWRDSNLEMLRKQSGHIGKRYLELYSGYAINKYHLTKRELECLHYVALGNTDEQIAKIMGIGRWTVVDHIKNAKIKLQCPNRASAVGRAVACGLIKLDESN